MPSKRDVVTRRKQKRRRLLAAALIVALAGGVGTYFALSGDGSSGPEDQVAPSPDVTPTDMPTEASENEAEGLAGGASKILALDNQVLKLFDVGSGESKEQGFIPTFTVAPSFGSEELAYVVDESPEGAPASQLFFFDTENEKEVRVGPGADVAWQPGGSHLAYLKPTGDGSCVENECTGPVTVEMLEAGGKEDDAETIGKAGEWELLGWAGADHVLLRDVKRGKPSKDGNVVSVSVAEGSKKRFKEFAATDVFGVSPDGAWLLTTGRQGARPSFIPLSEGGPAGDPIEIPTEATIQDGAWAHDSSQVMVVMTDVGTGVQELVRMWPDSPEPKPVPGSDGASGRVSWAPENDAFTYARLNSEDVVLEAVYCPLDDLDACEVVFDWQSGLVILRMQ